MSPNIYNRGQASKKENRVENMNRRSGIYRHHRSSIDVGADDTEINKCLRIIMGAGAKRLEKWFN